MSATAKLLAYLCALASMLVFSCSVAFAAGTLANTSISNTATLAYDVSGVTQPNITSLAATFVVDNKINLTVIEKSNSPTLVTPGQLRAVTTFTVTNSGNAVQDYALTGGNVAGAPVVFGSPDNFDALACNTFVEANSIADYQAGADTATFIDELAPDASIDVYTVCDIPAGQLSNDQAVTELTAVTRAGGTAGLGAVLTETIGANTNAVDIVFADPATPANGSGTIPLQIARDATAFARDAYRVAAVVANISKTATCSPSPLDCSQAKTGTVITYTIQVVLIGSGTVAGLVISDPLPSDVTYVPGSIRTDNVDALFHIIPGLTAKSDAGLDDIADFGFTLVNAITVKPGNIAIPSATQIFNITFSAKIN